MNKRLHKVDEGKKLCGVCTGIAQYLDFDVTIIRLLWVFVVLLGGAGVMAYIVCAIVMPDDIQAPPTDDSQYYHQDIEVDAE